MQVEIELKARLRDPEAARRVLDGMAPFVREFDKTDEYFLLPDGMPGQGRNFRLRHDGGTALVTWKRRSREGALEVNIEREFEVSDPQAFLELCLAMGAREYFTKRKIGREYALGGLRIELCQVPPLGHFIEIEHVAPTSAPSGLEAGPGEGPAFFSDRALVEGIRAQELDVLKKLGISQAEIEERTYSAMLGELGLWKA
jgi:adenylate cyclase, class 2